VKKNLLEVYALAACFASMIFLIVSVSMCLYAFLQFAAPSVTVSGYAYERSMSDEQFLQNWPKGRPVPEPSALSRLRREELERALRSERHDGLRSFLQSLMFAIAAGVVFWLHWALARRERAKTAASTNADAI
jgi:hypothetical protein